MHTTLAVVLCRRRDRWAGYVHVQGYLLGDQYSVVEPMGNVLFVFSGAVDLPLTVLYVRCGECAGPGGFLCGLFGSTE